MLRAKVACKRSGYSGRRGFSSAGISALERRHRLLLDEYLRNNGSNVEVLYNLSSVVVREKSVSLVRNYNHSIALAVQTLYPEIAWKPWRFKKHLRGLFDDIAKAFADGDAVAETFVREFVSEINTVDVGSGAIKDKLMILGGLDNVLKRLNGTNTKQQIYSRTKVTPRNRLQQVEALQRYNYVEFLKKQKGGKLESLYDAIHSDFLATGGGSIYRLYNRSPPALIMTEIPTHCWKPWKFRITPKLWFESVQDRFSRGDPIAETIMRQYIEEIATMHGVKQLADWYNVERHTLSPTTRYQMEFFGGLPALLRQLYPSHTWKFDEPEQPKGSVSDNYRRYSFEDAKSRRNALIRMSSSVGGLYAGLYGIQKHVIFSSGYRELFLLYDGSIPALVLSEFPEHAWKMWMFQRSPVQWWSQLASRFKHGDPIAEVVVRDYVDHILSSQHISDYAALETISLSASVKGRISRLGGLQSVIARLQGQASQHELRPFAPSSLPTIFWESKRNRQNFLEHLRSQLGGTMESLYNLTWSHVLTAGGRNLLARYNGSIAEMLIAEYPEHDWKMWKFDRAPRGWWPTLASKFASGEPKALKLVEEYVHDIATRYGLSNIEELLDLRKDEFKATDMNHIRMLGGIQEIIRQLKRADSSINATSVPKPFTDKSLPLTFWKSSYNRWSYFDYLKRVHGDENLYNISWADIVQSGGSRVLPLYKYSLAMAIMTEFPDHAWLPWRFSKLPARWLDELSSGFQAGAPLALACVRNFVEDLAQKHGVIDVEDWKQVNVEQLAKTDAAYLYKLGGIIKVLQKLYPDIIWNTKSDAHSKKVTQRLLARWFSQIFGEDLPTDPRESKTSRKTRAMKA